MHWSLNCRSTRWTEAISGDGLPSYGTVDRIDSERYVLSVAANGFYLARRLREGQLYKAPRVRRYIKYLFLKKCIGLVLLERVIVVEKCWMALAESKQSVEPCHVWWAELKSLASAPRS